MFKEGTVSMEWNMSMMNISNMKSPNREPRGMCKFGQLCPWDLCGSYLRILQVMTQVAHKKLAAGADQSIHMYEAP